MINYESESPRGFKIRFKGRKWILNGFWVVLRAVRNINKGQYGLNYGYV